MAQSLRELCRNRTEFDQLMIYSNLTCVELYATHQDAAFNITLLLDLVMNLNNLEDIKIHFNGSYLGQNPFLHII